MTGMYSTVYGHGKVCVYFTSNVCVARGGEAAIWALSSPEPHLQQLSPGARCQAEAGGITAHQARKGGNEKIEMSKSIKVERGRKRLGCG